MSITQNKIITAISEAVSYCSNKKEYDEEEKKDIYNLYNILKEEKKEELCIELLSKYKSDMNLSFMEEFLFNEKKVMMFIGAEKIKVSIPIYLYKNNEELFEYYVNKKNGSIESFSNEIIELKNKKINLLTLMYFKYDKLDFNPIFIKNIMLNMKKEELTKIKFYEEEQLNCINEGLINERINALVNKEKYFEYFNKSYVKIGSSILMKSIDIGLNNKDIKTLYINYKEKYEKIFTEREKNQVNNLIAKKLLNQFKVKIFDDNVLMNFFNIDEIHKIEAERKIKENFQKFNNLYKDIIYKNDEKEEKNYFLKMFNEMGIESWVEMSKMKYKKIDTKYIEKIYLDINLEYNNKIEERKTIRKI